MKLEGTPPQKPFDDVVTAFRHHGDEASEAVKNERSVALQKLVDTANNGHNDILLATLEAIKTEDTFTAFHIAISLLLKISPSKAPNILEFIDNIVLSADVAYREELTSALEHAKSILETYMCALKSVSIGNLDDATTLLESLPDGYHKTLLKKSICGSYYSWILGCAICGDSASVDDLLRGLNALDPDMYEKCKTEIKEKWPTIILDE